MTQAEKEQQFIELFIKHKDKIYRLCCGYLYDEKEADDLFQEIMVNIWQNLDSFRHEARIGTWVYRIAVNTSLLFNKKLKQKLNLFRNLDDSKATQVAVNGETAIETQTNVAQLRQCIASLKKQDRLIISLQLEGLSYLEISEIVGISTTFVGVKLNRIKKELETLMKEKVN